MSRDAETEFLESLADEETLDSSETSAPPAPAADPLEKLIIVYSVPQEKFIFKQGKTWQTSMPVGKAGAKVFLTHAKWTPMEIREYLECLELQTPVFGAEMAPGKPSVFKDSKNANKINLWVPPTIIPKPGEYPTIRKVLEHVTGNDPAGVSWLEQHLAAKVQNPNLVPKVATVFATAQGGGKGFLARVMFAILGEENCAIVKQSEVEGRFNSRFIQKLFVLADEILSSDNQKDASQLIKILVDGGELEMEGKFAHAVAVRSRLMFMFASNDVISPLVLENSDRRYSVFANHSPITPEYKTALDACFEADRVTLTPAFREEISAFAFYLHGLTIDPVLISKPLSNAARTDLIAANRQAHDLFCAVIDEEGIDDLLDVASRERPLVSLDRDQYDFGPIGVSFQALYQSYAAFCRQNGMKALRSAKFSHALAKRPIPYEQTRTSVEKGRKLAYVVKRKVAG